MLIVDANDPDRVRSILENDIEQTSERHQEVIAMYERGSNAAPAFGMIGTLIGLINMLKNLSDSDMETLGPSMSVALITTFYGSLLAHVVFNPIASNLTAGTKRRSFAVRLSWRASWRSSRARTPNSFGSA